MSKWTRKFSKGAGSYEEHWEGPAVLEKIELLEKKGDFDTEFPKDESHTK